MENPEYAEELEAFVSFLGNETLSVYHESMQQLEISFACKPRTAANINLCFISCICRISLPQGYPNTHRPLCSVYDTVGMMDEGLELNVSVERFILTLPLGEFFLFAIAEFITEYLDSRNCGECMICAESLNANLVGTSHAVGISEISVKTFCNHYFHIECLAKWASISLVSRRKSKSAKSQRERDELLLRAQDGQLKSSQQELHAVEARSRLLLAECESLRALIVQLKIDEQTAKTTKDGRRSLVAAEGSSAADNSGMSLAAATSKLLKLSADKQQADDKAKKISKRIESDQRNCDALRLSLASIRVQHDSWMLFPCPYCRHELSARFLSLDVVDSNQSPIEKLASKEAAQWDAALLRAIASCEAADCDSSSVVGAGASLCSSCDDCGGSSSGSGSGASSNSDSNSDSTGVGSLSESASTSSFMSLPEQMLTYIRNVQQYQREIKGKLKCRA